MKIGRLMISGLLTLLLLLALGCGGAVEPTEAPPATEPLPATDVPAPSPAADTPEPVPVDGKGIFTSVFGQCSACHTIEGVAEGMVGPDLTHIGTDAGTRKPGVSAEDYIRESIREPEAFVPEGVVRADSGLMTTAITAKLTDAQVNALVEFLLEQK